MLLICCSHLWSMMKLLLLLLPSCPCFPPLGLLWFQSLYMLITEDRDILGRGQSNITSSSSSFLSSLPSLLSCSLVPSVLLVQTAVQRRKSLIEWPPDHRTSPTIITNINWALLQYQSVVKLCQRAPTSCTHLSNMIPSPRFSIFNTQIIKSSLYLCDYESLNNRRTLT